MYLHLESKHEDDQGLGNLCNGLPLDLSKGIGAYLDRVMAFGIGDPPTPGAKAIRFLCDQEMSDLIGKAEHRGVPIDVLRDEPVGPANIPD